MKTSKKSQVAGEKKEKSNATSKIGEMNTDTSIVNALDEFTKESFRKNPQFFIDGRFSTKILADFFKERDCYKFFNLKDANEKERIWHLFNQVSEHLCFVNHLHSFVKVLVKGKFTLNQLSCIFQCYNNTLYKNEGISFRQYDLIEYIEVEGQYSYDLGNVNDFISEIKSLDPILYEVLVHVIIDAWNSERLSEVFNDLLGD